MLLHKTGNELSRKTILYRIQQSLKSKRTDLSKLFHIWALIEDNFYVEDYEDNPFMIDPLKTPMPTSKYKRHTKRKKAL